LQGPAPGERVDQLGELASTMLRQQLPPLPGVNLLQPGPDLRLGGCGDTGWRELAGARGVHGGLLVTGRSGSGTASWSIAPGRWRCAAARRRRRLPASTP